MAMTPKEKAEELVNKMYYSRRYDDTENYIPDRAWEHAKQCALTAVDEIFEFMKMDDEYTETLSNANSIWVNYWVEVKQEIEKL